MTAPARRVLLLVLAAAALTRLAYFAAIHDGYLAQPDSAAYESLALSLDHGGPYATDDVRELGGFPADLTRPPGYPLFLAAVNGATPVDRPWVAVVQIALSTVFALILALGVMKLLGSVTAGLLAGLVYAFDWVTIVHTPLILADAIYPVAIGAAILAAAYGMSRASSAWLAAGGAGMGCAALVKPAAVLVGVAVIAIVAFAVRAWRPTLAIATAFLMVITPWIARNKAEHNLFTISPIGIALLYFYTAQGTFEYESPIKTNIGGLGTRIAALDEQWAARDLPPRARRQAMSAEARHILAARWPMAVPQGVIGLARTMFGTAPATVRTSGAVVPWSLASLALAEIVAVWGMATIGLVRYWRSGRRGLTVLLFTVLVVVLLPSAEPGGNARFRTHATPVLAVAIAGLVLRRPPTESLRI
jgi:4-amino-4-deoxy-L-arabinose transferase-like glycosyltransferase